MRGRQETAGRRGEVGRSPVEYLSPTLRTVSGEVKVPDPAWQEWFSDYRIGRVGPYQIVRGELEAETPATGLKDWADELHLVESEESRNVLAIRRLSPLPETRWGLHIVLFALAFLSATIAGAFLAGEDPLATKFSRIGGVWLPVPTAFEFSELGVGLAFSMGFIGVLLGHELGHYFAARYHKVAVSPPFFLPFPPYFSLVGTLGAFIRLRGPIVYRSVLFDIGIAGPAVSFILSLPILFIGLASSAVVPTADAELFPFVIHFLGEPMRIGTSGLLAVVTAVVVPGYESGMTVVLHPLAFAGWLGLFVTALNLLPLGQLDGGHVLYAISGERQRAFGWAFVLMLIPLGFLWWGWWIWGGIAITVSRGRIAHPPVLRDEVPVGWVRKLLGWLALAFFVAMFSPAPLDL